MTLHDAPPRPVDSIVTPPSSGYSMRPAAVVLGLAALILIVFVTIGILTSTPAVTTNPNESLPKVSGTTLAAGPAASALAVIVKSGEPPSNIINAVVVPLGTVALSHQFNSAAADQYDAQIGLRSDASQGALESFYRVYMKAQGWQIFEIGAADHDPGGLEVLGKKAGSDGFYWEMGAVISATQFGPHLPARGATQFTIRLFQVPDPD